MRRWTAVQDVRTIYNDAVLDEWKSRIHKKRAHLSGHESLANYMHWEAIMSPDWRSTPSQPESISNLVAADPSHDRILHKRGGAGGIIRTKYQKPAVPIKAKYQKPPVQIKAKDENTAAAKQAKDAEKAAESKSKADKKAADNARKDAEKKAKDEKHAADKQKKQAEKDEKQKAKDQKQVTSQDLDRLEF